MQKVKIMKLFGIAMFACLSLAACSKNNAGKEKDAAPSGASDEAPSRKDKPTDSAAVNVSLPPDVSCETIRLTRTNDSGEEIIFAEYPKFTINTDGYDALRAALDSINQTWFAQSEDFLLGMEEIAQNNTDPSSSFCQSAVPSITRCDADIVCILVSRCVEEGGPHPNNYLNAYNFNAKTGELLKLSDILPADAALQEDIRARLYTSYPEISFDDAVVRQDIANALDNGNIEWYFFEGQLLIVFPENSFGLSHAEGSLSVSIS